MAARIVICAITVIVGISSLALAQNKAPEDPFIKVPNIRYAEHKGVDPRLNMLDVYMPRKGSNSPVVVFLHGGAWEFGDKVNVQAKPDYFTSRGYIFISVNYRLSPAVKHPVHVQDVADAIVWIHDNIRHYSGDGDNIFLIGHSAGAHLAALVSTDEEFIVNAKGSLDMIKATVLLDGAGYDIPLLMKDAKGKLRDWYLESFGTRESDWKKASPVTYIQPGKKYPKFLIIHAGERAQSQAAAEHLARKLKEADAEVNVLHYPKESHLSINRSIGKDDNKPTVEILRFLLKITSPFPAVN